MRYHTGGCGLSSLLPSLYRCLFLPTEQHGTSSHLPVDQSQSDGVAALSGPGRVRSKSEGEWCPRRADGEGAGPEKLLPCSYREKLHLLAHLTISSAGLGAALQCGSSRPAAQHPTHQDPAETPLGHTLPPACWRRGPAPQTGVSGKPRLQRPHGHRQGQGTANHQGLHTAEGLIVAVFHSRGVCRLAALAV